MYPNGAQFCLSMTFDIEMSYNFPYWTSDYDDYGAIDPHVKQYVHRLLDVADKYGVKLQFFVVGSALEDPDVDYLKRLVAEGHALDNHTYRHVNVKAERVADLHSGRISGRPGGPGGFRRWNACATRSGRPAGV